MDKRASYINETTVGEAGFAAAIHLGDFFGIVESERLMGDNIAD